MRRTMSPMSDAALGERPPVDDEEAPPPEGAQETAASGTVESLPDDTSPTGDAPPPSSSLSSSTLTTRDRLGALLERGRRILPWFSLSFGLVGALLMDRSPKSAWLIIAMAVLGWGAIIGFTALARLDPAHYTGRKRQAVKAARFLALMGSQTLMQNGLVFALPFYVQAAAWSLPQIAFLLVITAAAAITLWDPLYEAVVRGRLAAFALQGFASFCALNAVLPPLGMSNGFSLVTAGLGAAAGVPLQAWILSPVEKRKSAALALGLLFGLGIPLFVAFAGAPAIPPAPLKLQAAGIGRDVVERELVEPLKEVEGVPDHIYCWTAIAAPRGLKDELFHVWRKDGVVVDRVKLKVSGGRESGFRTWSRKTRFTKEPYGTWSCSVETAAGQLLGRRSIKVLAPPSS